MSGPALSARRTASEDTSGSTGSSSTYNWEATVFCASAREGRQFQRTAVDAATDGRTEGRTEGKAEGRVTIEQLGRQIAEAKAQLAELERRAALIESRDTAKARQTQAEATMGGLWRRSSFEHPRATANERVRTVSPLRDHSTQTGPEHSPRASCSWEIPFSEPGCRHAHRVPAPGRPHRPSPRTNHLRTSPHRGNNTTKMRRARGDSHRTCLPSHRENRSPSATRSAGYPNPPPHHSHTRARHPQRVIIDEDDRSLVRRVCSLLGTSPESFLEYCNEWSRKNSKSRHGEWSELPQLTQQACRRLEGLMAAFSQDYYSPLSIFNAATCIDHLASQAQVSDDHLAERRFIAAMADALGPRGRVESLADVVAAVAGLVAESNCQSFQ